MIRWKKNWENREEGKEPMSFCPQDLCRKLDQYRIQMQISALYKEKHLKVGEIPGYEGLVYTPAPARWIYSENYTDGRVTASMPENVFQDGFGYEVKSRIKEQVRAYYQGQATGMDLREGFIQTCTRMRQYRNEIGQTDGQNPEHNLQIVSQVYEMYAKENQRAARKANYAKGCAINGKFKTKDKRKQKDWCYYYSMYYYVCEEAGAVFLDTAQFVSEKWEISVPDIEEIEKLSKIDLRGGLGFNRSWNALYPNQISRVYMRDELGKPPENFQFFYKEYNPATEKGILVAGAGNNLKMADVPFNSFLENPREQIYNAGELIQFQSRDTDEWENYNRFLSEFSIFTRSYAFEA